VCVFVLRTRTLLEMTMFMEEDGQSAVCWFQSTPPDQTALEPLDRMKNEGVPEKETLEIGLARD
jgi:hypothetical protein